MTFVKEDAGKPKVEEIIEPVVVDKIDLDDFNEIKEEMAVDDGQKRLRFYEKLRTNLSGKLPKDGILGKLTDYLFLLPDFFMLLSRLLMDERVDNKTKGFILGVVAYVVMPIDFIPDFIPVIGFLDDLIIVVYAIDQILKYTDEKVLLDNWSGNRDLLLTIKKIIALVDSVVGQRLLTKIKQFLAKIF